MDDIREAMPIVPEEMEARLGRERERKNGGERNEKCARERSSIEVYVSLILSSFFSL